ncbi:hypothetical protein GCM10011521_21230 [Arenimonas soli]|uniref:Lipoprotein n=1 Tax=Arenimonas soli TaxID=2269504 RepID=A0ABQ1HMW7_9GAMM|nr:hypothetical protein GCM10011521_21230 [Arenimonas soli]
MRTIAVIAAIIFALVSCASLPPLTGSASLSVLSYDQATGDYVLELRNHFARPILYLNPYLTFHVVRSPSPESFPESPGRMALMVHDTKLEPGKAVTFSGQCTSAGICSRPGTYVAVRACWFTEAWTCEEYLPVWSETPLNGA